MKDIVKTLTKEQMARLSGKIPAVVKLKDILDARQVAIRTIDKKHKDFSAELGNPISDYLSRTSDFYRYYEGGMVYYYGSSRKAYEVHGEIYKHYQELGGIDGHIGAPESDEVESNNGWSRHSVFFYNLIAWKAGELKVFSNRPHVTATWNPGNLQMYLAVGVKGQGFSGSSKITLWTVGFSQEVDNTYRQTFISKPDGTFDTAFRNFDPVSNRPIFKVMVEDPDSGLTKNDGTWVASNSIMAVW